MLKCTINGQALEVKPGTTIMEAMHEVDQHIAHYCWHPGLSIAGVCRLCMVEIKGNPRPQIACNTVVTEGMEVNNTSAIVTDAVKWGLDFHLINHPLDCPICDQAGECGLQEQYMEYGKYTPEMTEAKVKKHKVVDLGPRVVLDSERCILCSRCVRFTDEVSKTHELGIFNRGDRAEIGTVPGQKLDNNYSMNTVDICPVGALTSKDFRFRQRVWFLKEVDTICNGCSTGCNITLYYNKEGVFRAKPVFNEKVNGYWMCDVGRDVYKFINRDHRILDAQFTTGAGSTPQFLVPDVAAQKIAKELNYSAALVLTGQYTSEEYESLMASFKTNLGSTQIYHWINNPEDLEKFDGILYRGDHNPNTKGLEQILSKNGLKNSWAQLEKDLSDGKIETLVVAAPENQAAYPDLSSMVTLFAKAKKLVWLSSVKTPALDKVSASVVQIPMKSFFEKNGTFVNYQGIEQKTRKGFDLVPQALTLTTFAELIAGQNPSLEETKEIHLSKMVHNEYAAQRDAL